MNTHDVSDNPQFVQLMLKQQQRLREAESSKGQQAKFEMSPGQLVPQFMFRMMMRGTASPMRKFAIQTTYIPPAYTPCITPLNDLTKIMISDLLLETHHRGKYLLLKTITPPDRINAIMAIVQDERQNATTLTLYFREEEHQRPAAVVLREGTALIVKEPYLKLMADGVYGIRVDHLCDLIYLASDDERLPNAWRPRITECDIDANMWRLRGNDAFKTSEYEIAIECYTEGLGSSPTADETRILMLNRSLAFIRIMKYDAALSDAESACSDSKLPEKALVRKAQCLYALRDFQNCHEALKLLCAEYPNQAFGRTELARVKDRLIEQEKGQSRFKQMYQEIERLRPPHLDHATYIGPVSVQASGTHGRGLFTTKAVKAGDLLLCEKAFVHAFVNAKEQEHEQRVNLLINLQTKSMAVGSQANLLQMAIQKMYRNPSLASIITNLHHGSYQPVNTSQVDGIPIVDTFLVERIVSLNVFGCPLSSRENHLLATAHGQLPKPNNIGEHFRSTGIWPTASYINHSCNSNAHRSFIGDMMIVRATRDLDPNTEITFWYQPPANDNYSERQKKFKHQWGFECTCSICCNDKAASKTTLARRKTLMSDILHAFQMAQINVDKIERLLKVLKTTYARPPTEVPRLKLLGPLFALARLYTKLKQPRGAIDACLGFLAALGFVVECGKGVPLSVQKWGLVEDSLIECWMLLAGGYRHLREDDSRTRVLGYAKITYRICVGEDETFDETCVKGAGF